jgi:hypothetical protein
MKVTRESYLAAMKAIEYSGSLGLVTEVLEKDRKKEKTIYFLTENILIKMGHEIEKE